MDRKDFFKSCAYACLSGVALTTILQSCSSTKILNIILDNGDIALNMSEFEIIKKEKKTFLKYILLQNESLAYPIVVFRFNNENYSAVNLKCTHQGAELQVFGDKLVCPAHGSEFSNQGKVENGPAIANLRAFPISIVNNQVIISLK